MNYSGVGVAFFRSIIIRGDMTIYLFITTLTYINNMFHTHSHLKVVPNVTRSSNFPTGTTPQLVSKAYLGFK